jgi:phosphoribosylformylglycinamidine synthase
MMQSVIDFANRGGKVLGVCNGFQILCESKLLPGALLRNNNQKFICQNVWIAGDDGAALKIPIAHGEGRYYADAATLDYIESNKLVIYRYCDQNGKVNASANPNGSINNIAGICNVDRNVFGMMPHPERAVSSALGNVDGKKVFRDLLIGEMQAIQA